MVSVRDLSTQTHVDGGRRGNQSKGMAQLNREQEEEEEEEESKSQFSP